MTVKFTLGWSEPTEDKLDALRKIGCVLPADPKSYSTYEGDSELVCQLPFEVTIQPMPAEYFHIAEILKRLSSIESRIAAIRNEATFNDRCNVHVPGLGLLLIDEVKLVDDCCTDSLAELLEDGWRIIAACPQPDSRRPDYILGRTKAK